MQERASEGSGEPGYFLGRFPAYAVCTVHGPGEILERLLAKGAELFRYVTSVSGGTHTHAGVGGASEWKSNKGGTPNGTAQWARPRPCSSQIHPPWSLRLPWSDQAPRDPEAGGRSISQRSV